MTYKYKKAVIPAFLRQQELNGGDPRREQRSCSHIDPVRVSSLLSRQRDDIVLVVGMAFICLILSACGTQEPTLFNSYGVDKGAGSVGIHTVLEGDTVYSIAKNYQLPIRDIIVLNKIQAPYELNAGYRMKLPPPNEHRVRAGDTVQTIARMYEVSPNRLVELNNLEPPYRLLPRQPIRLPTPTMQYAQNAVVQNTPVTQQPVQTARVQGVERQVLEPTVEPSVSPSAGRSVVERAPTAQAQNNAPAKVQEASMTRAELPEVTPKMSGSGKFMRPVDGRIISNYGPKADGLHNDGINIKAVRGAPVRAAENGVVVYNGDDLEGYGNLVLIRHENKMMSAYAHLDKTLVKRGAKVVRGQSIGTVGSTGQVDTPQLHFEIRKGSTPLDPMKYL